MASTKMDYRKVWVVVVVMVEEEASPVKDYGPALLNILHASCEERR